MVRTVTTTIIAITTQGSNKYVNNNTNDHKNTNNNINKTNRTQKRVSALTLGPPSEDFACTFF